MATINHIRGDSRTINVQVYQSDGVTPFNLTGGKVYFTLNSNSSPVDDTSDALQKVVTSFSNPTLGQATINLVSNDTQNLTPGNYFYDVEAIDASGDVVSLPQGTFVLKPDITRTNT